MLSASPKPKSIAHFWPGELVRHDGTGGIGFHLKMIGGRRRRRGNARVKLMGFMIPPKNK
ncbi:hypothetical protein EYF80_001597 [Liparis tanakae]|uniref:Uncharacterized protein n=1 Tax=Liparis tanakae TaxID=230148 RepID=A0A4Z2JCR9_9TELE|nr:hypothetical protein EYF80_001597 [Liparis tanakae]